MLQHLKKKKENYLLGLTKEDHTWVRHEEPLAFGQ